MLRFEDFQIKMTKSGQYSVYRVAPDKTFCLRSHIKDISKARGYIEWLVDYINANYPEEPFTLRKEG